jgi:cytidylate kinase
VGYSVVCISATEGAAAEEIAPLVADRLGFRLVGEQIIARAAEEAGVKPHVVADVEQRKRFVSRMLKEIPAGGAGAGYTLAAGMPIFESSGPGDDDLRGLIRSAIEEVAEQGDAVIVAHAAALALDGREHALRVFVTASPQKRAERIAAARECGDKEARKLVSRGDADRADYRKRFYAARSEGPADYDLIVNTDRLPVERAADLIAQAAAA